MATKRFRSKIDRWVLFALIAAVIGVFGAMVAVAIHPEGPVSTTVVILICLASIALMVWLFVGTHYTVNKDLLTIASGPLRRKVHLDQITSVEATRSALSSPALSLDRLRIRYGNNRHIMISPADKQGFLRAIGHQLKADEAP